MSQLADQYSFREELSDAVVCDIVGPVSGEREVITDPPITRYLAGILYPSTDRRVAPEQDLDDSDGYDEAVTPDPAVAMANQRDPSSIGLTFAVDDESCRHLRVTVTAGRYSPVESADDNDARGTAGAATKTVWHRVPLELDAVTIDVTAPAPGRRQDIGEGLILFQRVRPQSRGGVAITLVLINQRRAEGLAGRRDAAAVFQPEILVEGVEPSGPTFVDRSAGLSTLDDDEIATNELLFRHVKNFAIGHGCAVAWEQDSDGEVSALRTTFTPVYDLLLADSNPAIDLPALDMRRLAVWTRSELVAETQKLVDGYHGWIERRAQEATRLDARFIQAAEVHIDRCREAAARMQRGVDLLGDPTRDEVFHAFRLTNEAMIEQRVRSEKVLNGRIDLEPASIPARWRPFQLGFILLCLDGIADPSGNERSLADLLWFPTGGGKTEAYLGLIAFTIFLRRLDGRGGGVTALMRYTLRLLTIQQFERAALLICCCEALRQDREDLGADEISIGLYVGRGATPLTLAEAKRALNKLRVDPKATPKEGNPVQLHQCPWCGTHLDAYKYRVLVQPSKLLIACKNDRCSFKSGLPVYVVDDDLYQHRPSLVIGTVDKFAGLPWRDKVAALFNRDSRGGHGLDLIIQDELHLISGPLGTLTGLYETAVDELAGRDGHRAKVIASTATIRRATQQGRGLFDRELRQFPSPGLDARDSYFAVEAPAEVKASRRYLGLMAPGKSHTTLLVRAYGALLQHALEIDGAPDIRDPYWTLVGYFNSLRVLGGARLQVQDDVKKWIDTIASDDSGRRIGLPIELTSRASSVDIPGYLQQMKTQFPDEGTLDIILATNMISVGVDIDRLGLMAVMGQPQSTSEYIQATSRVGRRYPGLIVVLYNAGRSRDRSHYESFVPFHGALYREVDSTSVTPFSTRARDRGIHAVLIALCRQLVGGLRENTDAVHIADHIDEVQGVRDRILERIESVDSEEVDSAREQLDAVIDAWIQRAAEEPNLVYSNPTQPDRGLLVEASVDLADDPKLHATLWSLRDVDKTSNLYPVKL